MDNRPQKTPEGSAPNIDTLLDREIAVALRSGVKQPSADFTYLLMSEIEIEAQPAIVPIRQKTARLPLYLIGLSLALIVSVVLLPGQDSASTESLFTSSSVLWTVCAVGLIALLGLTQSPRFGRILSR